MRELDETDRRILRVMLREGDLTAAQIAERAGLSAAPCWRRIDRMTREGIILGRSARIDWARLGYAVRVFLRVTLDKTAPRAFDEFVAAARELPEVVTLQTLLGRVDVRMDVIARDLDHYRRIYREKILPLPHIADLESLLLVSELKNDDWAPV
ncbi:Lrp/AsnC family transcriptional regulator [Oceanicella actignis]|uniref:Lrp/AsnC family transcriptional regulator n=1 Tax=Oceanicella actignis TaxID=1189325 RepID=A0A1M7RTE0_9RHOB|nr:Lrp/AsnC family transcriptional regulator [Oceanicella actignis]SET05024.1 Lrp/AsnC family transcriptional regulator [Oceanicella actignis]SHN49396.1 Lrp/AsnC family transcriptional regulator [Oceanicella actignis]